jgi:hypothetical protein
VPAPSEPDDDGLCSWGSCATPSAALVRCRNVLGLPTGEAYWLCAEHARRMVENCPRGDFVEARTAPVPRGR